MKKLSTLFLALLASFSLQAKTIFSTDVLATVSGTTVTSGNGDFTAGSALSWSSPCENYFLTSGSAGYYQLAFTSAISLADYSNVKIKVYWGAGSNRPLNLTVNEGSATKIDEVTTASDRSKLREIETDLSESSLSLIKLSSSGGGNVYLFRIEITGTQTKFSVTYEENGHGEAQTDLTSQTNLPNPLPELSEVGWTFGGWFADDGTFEEEIEDGGSLTQDTILYAKWTEISNPSHTITYTNLKEQSVEGYPTKYYEGIGIASFAALADTEDEHFTGWSPSSIATTATTDQTITATWEAKKVVTFNSNGGSAVTTQKVVSGETVEEPTAPTRLNYTFQKWQLNGVDYNFSTTVTGDITLDAVWTRNTITGSATENYTADTEHNKEVTSATSYTANSFSLKKIDNGTWTIAADKSSATGDGKTFAYAFLPGNGSTDTKGWELTATKGISSLVVYYTMTDGSFSTKDQSKSGNFTYKINSNDAVVSSTTGDKSNKTAYKETISSIKKGDIVKLYSSANRLAFFAIYATYEADPLYVKFMVNGTKTDSITTTTGEKLGNLFMEGELPTPSVQGYTFNGWKNAANDADVDKNTAVGEVSLVIYADLTDDSSTAIDNTNEEAKAVKFIKDGQIFIEKNGHVYNVLGGCVK